MPNRILRDWTDSYAVNELDAPAERFFTRLIMKADDFGRFHADVRLLKANLFPLLPETRDTDIPRWIAACEKAGLIRCYVDARGRQFLEIQNFRQRTRQSESKFPSPDQQESSKSPPLAEQTTAKRQADDGQTTGRRRSNDRQTRTETETETYAETETETLVRKVRVESKSSSAAEQQAAEISGLVTLLRGLYGVTDSTGVQLNDQISTLAIELHGAGIDRGTVQGFWDYRTVKPQLWPAKRFVGDCLAWRASNSKGSRRNGSAHIGASNGQAIASKNWNPPAEPESFSELRAALRELIEPAAYSTWFAPVRFTHLDDQVLIVQVPDTVFGDWILNNYRDAVCAALQTAGFVDVADLRFVGGE